MIIHSISTKDEPTPTASRWKEVVAKYQQPALRRSVWQVVNTLVPYAALWCLMYLSLGVSYWLTVPLALLAAGFLVRVFIIFHDCGHGSFFKSRKANDILGFITGVLTFTPYYHWRWEHALHHASSGDLDRRGTGDVWTLTVQEYLEASRWKRFAYRLARNPFMLFVLAPLFLFVDQAAVPLAQGAGRGSGTRCIGPTWRCLAMVAGLSCLFGLKAYLLLQLGVLWRPARPGVWLFYVQHQFEGVYWERGETWDYCHGGAARQLVLQTAQGAAVVFGQHRVPSHPSSEPAHSQLQPGEVPPGGAAVSDRQAGDALCQPQVLDLPALG